MFLMNNENNNNPETKKKVGFSTILKNLFFILLILQLVPIIFSSMRSWGEDVLSSKTAVGCLTIKGPITDASFYIKKIDEFSKSTEIKALLIKINSPGGYSGTCHAIFNELKKFAKTRPVVAVIENAGASGAYYIAAASHSIVASPLSLVGSIGVFMELPNVKDLLASWHVNYQYVQSGEYKTAGSAVKELSEKELAYLQRLSDDQYEQFISDVAECRKLSKAKHKDWADGKAFTGRQAFDLKLVDILGSYSDAVTELKKRAKIDGEIRFVTAHKTSGLMKLLSSGEEEASEYLSFSDLAASFFRSLCLGKVAEPQGLQAQL